MRLIVIAGGMWVVGMVGYIFIKIKGNGLNSHNGLDISNELRKYKTIQSSQTTNGKLFGK